MGLFNLINRVDINKGVEEHKQHSGSVLLDVRTPDEYKEGHIPGSINIPLQQIEQAQTVIPDKNTKIYVYCRSGSRSSQATAYLFKMGYANVNNIGGILNYEGEVVR